MKPLPQKQKPSKRESHFNGGSLSFSPAINNSSTLKQIQNLIPLSSGSGIIFRSSHPS